MVIAYRFTLVPMLKKRILYFKLGSVIRDNTGMLTNHFNSVYMHCG